MAERDAANQPTAPPLDARYLEQISAGLDRAIDKAAVDRYADVLRLEWSFRRAGRYHAVSAPRPGPEDLVAQMIAPEGP
jgi:hypothetical protein